MSDEPSFDVGEQVWAPGIFSSRQSVGKVVAVEGVMRQVSFADGAMVAWYRFTELTAR